MSMKKIKTLAVISCISLSINAQLQLGNQTSLNSFLKSKTRVTSLLDIDKDLKVKGLNDKDTITIQVSQKGIVEYNTIQSKKVEIQSSRKEIKYFDKVLMYHLSRPLKNNAYKEPFWGYRSPHNGRFYSNSMNNFQ